MKIQAFIRLKYDNLTSREKRIAQITAIATCLLIVIVGCKTLTNKKVVVEPLMIRKGGQITVPKNSPLRAEIIIQTVLASHCAHTESFPGVVEVDPSRTVDILPPLTGRLMTLNNRLGDKVKKGQVLAVVSSPDLAAAFADHDKANSLLQFAQDDLKRAKADQRNGGISLKELQLSQSNYAQASAQLAQTTARLKTLGSNTFSQLAITAPFSGQITDLNYGVGAFINDLTVPVFTLSNIDSVLVTAFIPENFVGAISKGQRADIVPIAYPDKVLYGQVSFVTPLIDKDTHRNKTRIVMKNPQHQLQPNMYATVRIAIKQAAKASVPISAIIMNNDTTSVYVEKSDWVFERKEVQLENEDGDHVHVLSGLHIGDRIVVSGGVFMND